MKTNKVQQQLSNTKGFTLIELIIVIVILGILSVTVAPRFIDLSGDAKIATSRTIMTSFDQAVQLAHYKWNVSGQNDTISIQGKIVDMSTDGYPDNVTGDTQGCIDLWENILDSSVTVQEYSSGSTAPEWSLFGFNLGCIYFNEGGQALDTSETPYFLYLVATGEVFGTNMK
jgi:prepilin-type N-terminal cleavage/methylation domain-containing protein